MWKRTGMTWTVGSPLMGRSWGSFTVSVSIGAAVIHVSGGRFRSIFGVNGLRHATPNPTAKRQSKTPDRKRIRALQDAQSLGREVPSRLSTGMGGVKRETCI